MTTTAHELGATVGAWNAVVRRARIGRDRKAAALVVSSYANTDGTGIHCGVARFATDIEASYRTGRRYLAWLREVGLIELVREGNHRRGRSDEYRLILGPDILEHLDVPNPESYDDVRDGIREANRGRRRSRGDVDQGSIMVTRDQSTLQATQDDPQSGPGEPGSQVIMVTPDNRDRRSNGHRSQVTLDDPPPSLITSPKRSTSPTTAERDLRTDVAVGGAPASEEPAVVVEIFPGASQEAPYRPPPRWSSRGQDAITQAQAARAAAVAAHRARKEAN